MHTSSNHNEIDDRIFSIAEAERDLPRLFADDEDWTPRRITASRGVAVHMAGHGPSVAWRLDAQAARISSGRYSGQHDNDNQNWPLAKLLKTEGHDRQMALATHYREMFDHANEPTQLVGRDIADNIYVMARGDLDESSGIIQPKGTKHVAGKVARPETAATKASVTATDDAIGSTKKRAKAVAKAWQGDWPLLHAIDARKDLARARAALGMLTSPFEAAVCGNDTFEKIGRDLAIGNPKGATGAGRAVVFLGFDALEQHWQRERMAA